jgi:hypothetical protein
MSGLCASEPAEPPPEEHGSGEATFTSRERGIFASDGEEEKEEEEEEEEGDSRWRGDEADTDYHAVGRRSTRLLCRAAFDPHPSLWRCFAQQSRISNVALSYTYFDSLLRHKTSMHPNAFVCVRGSVSVPRASAAEVVPVS